jgi:A1 cistron-splicing factor AAR2
MLPPYRLDISPDDARRLAQSGATVLMLNLPPSCVVGVDHQAFHAGPRFKGIKMIPPGIHFFSCRQIASSGSEPSGAGCPVGFFSNLLPGQVLVKTYDVFTEQLLDMEEIESRRFEEGARRFEFDNSLAPYDLHSYRLWLSLSSHLTPEIISDLSPAGRMNISIMNEAALDDLSEPKTDAEKELVKQLREGREQAHGRTQVAAVSGMEVEGQHEGKTSDQAGEDTSASGRCFYTSGLPSERLVKGVKGMTPAQLTQLNLDRSSIVLEAFGKRYGRQSGIAPALGETQFAFIAFLFGQSLDGFTQWRALVTNLLSCEDIALDPNHQEVFAGLLSILKSQISISIPDESEEKAGGEESQDASSTISSGLPMMDALLSDSFLKSLLGRFFSMIQSNSQSVQAGLQCEAQGLKQLLRKRLEWEFDIRFVMEEDDEDEPTIVDMEEELISF